MITNKPTDGPFAQGPVMPPTYGAVEGYVETLQRHAGLRFTLYEALSGRAVSCYLDEGEEERMRDAWGKRASVEGWIRRDPVTGRPLTVRRITDVRIIPTTSDAEGYRRARGAIPWPPGPLPEAVVRQLRDA